MESKRAVVLELSRLGMDFDRAVIIAECTLPEIEEMQNDAQYMARISFSAAVLERDLLKKMETIVDMNSAVGQSTEVRWLLERINPKWAGSTKIVGKGGGPLVITYDDGD